MQSSYRADIQQTLSDLVGGCCPNRSGPVVSNAGDTELMGDVFRELGSSRALRPQPCSYNMIVLIGAEDFQTAQHSEPEADK